MSTMQIEIHAAVPTRFQDTKPTVESNELQTNQIELHRSPSFPMACGPSFQYDRWRVLMRALFSAIGSRGDVQPVVALASHLKALGHDVRSVCRPTFASGLRASASQ